MKTSVIISVLLILLLNLSSAQAQVSISPDGKTALSDKDSIIKLWDLTTGREIKVFQGHTGSITALAFSPDNKSILSGGEDGTVRLWNISDSKELWSINKEGDPRWPLYREYGNRVNSIILSQDGKAILVGQRNGSIKLLDIATGKELRRFNQTDNYSRFANLSSDNKYAVSTSTDKGIWTIHYWDVATGNEINRFTDTSTAIYAAFLPDGKTVLTGGKSSLRIWEIATGKPLRTLTNPTLIDSATLSPDGSTALVGAAYQGNGVITVWDVSDGKIIRQLKGHTENVVSLAFTSNSKSAMSASRDGNLILWDISSGRIIRKWKA